MWWTIGYWVTRLGLTAGASWLIPALLFGGLSLGGASSWLLGWTDYKTAILAVVVIAAVVFLISTNSTWGRIAAVVVIVGGAYIKGRIDEGLETEAKIAAREAAIHQVYKEASDAEKARQAGEAEEARKRAEAETVAIMAERDKLRQALKDLQKEAIDDPDAMRDAFSVDAINRLNQLRFERRPAAPRSLDPKTKARRPPVLDDPPVPAPEAPRPN